MRIFVAGASGVIGVRLVPLLTDAGHTVAGMTRTPAKAGMLKSLGAQPVVCDVYDQPALIDAVVAFAPDLVMHQLTDLPDDVPLIRAHAARNARMRREGTRNLLEAAQAAAAKRFLAQSVAWELPGDAGAATRELERAVLEAAGVVLRYGRFYGTGTYYETELPAPPRIEVERAARRTVAALDAEPGIITIVDDDGDAQPTRDEADRTRGAARQS